MRITINEQTIDYTLEHETTLGEVVGGIEKWLDDSDLRISAVTIDDQELPLMKKEEWTSIPLEEISELDITAATPLEYSYNSFRTVNEYIQALIEAVNNNDSASIRELYNEYEPIKAFLERFFSGYQDRNSLQIKTLHELIHHSGVPEGTIKEEQSAQRLVQFLESISLLIIERIREIVTPVDELEGLITLLETTNEKIRDVSVLLQTGKDREAMTLVVQFTELSQKLLRLYSILHLKKIVDPDQLTVHDKPLEAFYQELNTFFMDLQEAFTVNDSVLIGDLFEYEISPRMEELLSCLRRLHLTLEAKEE